MQSPTGLKQALTPSSQGAFSLRLPCSASRTTEDEVLMMWWALLLFSGDGFHNKFLAHSVHCYRKMHLKKLPTCPTHHVASPVARPHAALERWPSPVSACRRGARLVLYHKADPLGSIILPGHLKLPLNSDSGTLCFLLRASTLREITALPTGISRLGFWITNLIKLMYFFHLILHPWEIYSFEYLFKSCDLPISSSMVIFW